jgi:hypothetical protein
MGRDRSEKKHEQRWLLPVELLQGTILILSILSLVLSWWFASR